MENDQTLENLATAMANRISMDACRVYLQNGEPKVVPHELEFYFDENLRTALFCKTCYHMALLPFWFTFTRALN